MVSLSTALFRSKQAVHSGANGSNSKGEKVPFVGQGLEPIEDLLHGLGLVE